MIGRILNYFFSKPKTKMVKQCEWCDEPIPAGPDYCCVTCWKSAFNRSWSLYAQLVEDERQFNRLQWGKET